MSESFKKTQKPEPERPKERTDSAKFIRENEDALDYPDVPDEKRDYQIDDKHLPEHLRGSDKNNQGNKQSDFQKFCEENADALDYPDVPDESRDRGYPADDSWMTPEIKAACDKRQKEYEDMMDYPDVPTGEGAYKIDDSIFDADALEAMEAARKAHEAKKTK